MNLHDAMPRDTDLTLFLRARFPEYTWEIDGALYKYTHGGIGPFSTTVRDMELNWASGIREWNRLGRPTWSMTHDGWMPR